MITTIMIVIRRRIVTATDVVRLLVTTMTAIGGILDLTTVTGTIIDNLQRVISCKSKYHFSDKVAVVFFFDLLSLFGLCVLIVLSVGHRIIEFPYCE